MPPNGAGSPLENSVNFSTLFVESSNWPGTRSLSLRPRTPVDFRSARASVLRTSLRLADRPRSRVARLFTARLSMIRSRLAPTRPGLAADTAVLGGAGGGSRTLMPLRAGDFESPVSAIPPLRRGRPMIVKGGRFTETSIRAVFRIPCSGPVFGTPKVYFSYFLEGLSGGPAWFLTPPEGPGRAAKGL